MRCPRNTDVKQHYIQKKLGKYFFNYIEYSILAMLIN